MGLGFEREEGIRDGQRVIDACDADVFICD
jgi:hypothetical protein